MPANTRTQKQQEQPYLVIANWKMHPATRAKARELFRGTKEAVRQTRHVRVVVCPPALYLTDLLKGARSARLSVGAQNAHWEKTGAYTGSISAAQLANVGVQFVILGHSEQRQPAGRQGANGETSAAVAAKARAVLAAGMTPIICVGEDARDPGGAYVTALRRELRESVDGLRRTHIGKLYIAYEPRWKIGENASSPLSPEELHTTSLILKKELAERYDVKTGENARILYGGSAGPDTAGGLVRDSNIDGLLVGSASLNAKTFGKLLKAVESTKDQ